MDESKEPAWRDIWQEIIKATGEDLRNKDKELNTLQEIEKKYPNDKMILFEKAIAYEIIGDKDNAKKYYTEASDENTGLPVKHWRKRAKYFLDRIEKRGCSETTDLNPLESCEQNQWNVYFNIHSYYYLDSYIRYLAISSVSRLYSEPSMAIVIFRTCLEIGLWTYFENDCQKFNEIWQKKNKKTWRIGLDDLLTNMHENGTLKKFNNEYTAYDKIRHEGNIAAHPGKINKNEKPFRYNNDDLFFVLDYFNQTLRFLNERAKNNK